MSRMKTADYVVELQRDGESIAIIASLERSNGEIELGLLTDSDTKAHALLMADFANGTFRTYGLRRGEW
jgi:hypothetical protein